jgi:hypothetical protein
MFFLWLTACSLMTIDYEACTDDYECVEAHGEGYECDPDIGLCMEPDTGGWEDTGEWEDTGDDEGDTGDDDDRKRLPLLDVLNRIFKRTVHWITSWVHQTVLRG